MPGEKQVPFHGILAVGSTEAEAINNYRLLALGKSVSAFADEAKNFVFVGQASSSALGELFNPMTGDMDIERADSLVQNLEFQSNSGTNVEVNHYVCESGCGSHLVFDSKELVQFCPVCTSAVVESSDEEDDTDEEDLEDEDDFDAESSDEESSDDEEDFDLDEDEEDGEDDGDVSESSDDEEFAVVASSFAEARSMFIEQVSASGTSLSSSDIEAEYVVCSDKENCGAHIMSTSAVSECPNCHASTQEPEQEEDQDEEDDDESEDTLNLSDEIGTSESGDDDEESDDVEEDESEEDESEEDESDTEAEPEADVEPEPAVVASSEEAEQEDEAEQDDANTEDDAEVEAGCNKAESAVEPQHIVSISSFALFSEDKDSHRRLDLSYSNSINGEASWTAYYDGKPVAMCSAKDAGRNIDIFSDVAFGKAALAGAKHVGVKAILTDMGFKPIEQSVSISSYVEEMVEQRTSEVLASVEADKKEYNKQLMAAMATAAIGINRGFFAGQSNPVKHALMSALSTAGVHNPEVLVDNAFRKSSDQYHKQLFEKSLDILSKPAEVRESLAKAVLEVNYVGTSLSSSGSQVEERLASMGTVTASASTADTSEEDEEPQTQSLSSSFNQKMSAVVSGLGRRR